MRTMTFVCKWKSMSPQAHHRRRPPPPRPHFDFTPVFVLRAVANGGYPLITFMCKFPIRFVNICAKLFTFFLISSLLLCCTSENARNFGNANYDASAIPKLDVNDLANLIEMFPEFREYVYQALASHVQQIQTTPVPPTTPPPNNISENVMQIWGNWQKNALSSLLPVVHSPVSGGVSAGEKVNSRKDSSSYAFYGSGVQPEVKDVRASSKHSSYHGYYPPQQEYGYGHHYKDHFNYYPQKAASHHNHHGWGWSNEGHTDPKFHYEVGYELGKDLSCLFGLLGFKSLKDLTFFSFFSFFKKLKYMALIGLAFKLGVFLSPVALPLLFPVIILAVIAKVLPLLLIIVLLFKLLKAQFKLKGVGREDYYGGGVGINSILEGTHISRLWQSIEEAQERIGVVQSEGEDCVEKIICTINQRGSKSGKGRGFISDFLVNEVLPTLPRILPWVYPSIQWRRGEINSDPKQKHHVYEDERMFVCEKIQCSPNRRKLNSEETLEESTTLLP